jgi:hypothetical protein
MAPKATTRPEARNTRCDKRLAVSPDCGSARRSSTHARISLIYRHLVAAGAVVRPAGSSVEPPLCTSPYPLTDAAGS